MVVVVVVVLALVATVAPGELLDTSMHFPDRP